MQGDKSVLSCRPPTQTPPACKGLILKSNYFFLIVKNKLSCNVSPPPISSMFLCHCMSNQDVSLKIVTCYLLPDYEKLQNLPLYFALLITFLLNDSNSLLIVFIKPIKSLLNTVYNAT